MEQLAFEFEAEPLAVHKDVEFSVYSAMETGNTGRARMLMQEYAEQYPVESEALRASLTRDYGTAL